ncbi:MAG: DUF190 domain-containing protein [Mariprofundaceae bacterium]
MQAGLGLRIYLSESDRIDGKPAIEAILELCQQAGLYGVTVLRGIEGLGEHGIHTSSFLSLSSHLPLLVEAMDLTQKIKHAVEIMQPHLQNKLVATWPISIMHHKEPS